MNLTRTGLAASFAAVGLFVASVALRGFVIGVVLLLVLLAVAADAAWVWAVTRSPGGRFVLSAEGEGEGRVLLHPGEESTVRVRFTTRVRGRVEVGSRLEFLEVRPRVVPGGVHRTVLEFRFRTPYAGEYEVDSVDLKVTGALGLLESGTKAGLHLKYPVYPRVTNVAAASIRLLGKGGIGETPIEMPGIGTEYYEIREYYPGDDFRNVNWRATARQGELMVNQRMREVGTSFLLMLDAAAPSYSDADRLATAFLTAANTLAAANVKFGVIVHTAGRVEAYSGGDDPRGSLAVALREALRIAKIEGGPELPELEPVRAALKREGDGGAGVARGVPGFGWERAKSRFESGDAWMRALEVAKEGATQTIICVTGLFGPVEPLIELAWNARHYGSVGVSVADPCQPWSEAKDEEEAAGLRAMKRRVQRGLNAGGVRVFAGEPVGVARSVLASA